MARAKILFSNTTKIPVKLVGASGKHFYGPGGEDYLPAGQIVSPGGNKEIGEMTDAGQGKVHTGDVFFNLGEPLVRPGSTDIQPRIRVDLRSQLPFARTINFAEIGGYNGGSGAPPEMDKTNQTFFNSMMVSLTAAADGKSSFNLAGDSWESKFGSSKGPTGISDIWKMKAPENQSHMTFFRVPIAHLPGVAAFWYEYHGFKSFANFIEGSFTSGVAIIVDPSRNLYVKLTADGGMVSSDGVNWNSPLRYGEGGGWLPKQS